eukprot:837211-Pyramimonas_sp.AAC.2
MDSTGAVGEHCADHSMNELSPAHEVIHLGRASLMSSSGSWVRSSATSPAGLVTTTECKTCRTKSRRSSGRHPPSADGSGGPELETRLGELGRMGGRG